jgi:hypothetical protein
VKVLTGDNPVVTCKVCREVGLEPGQPLLGQDIERMDDASSSAGRRTHGVRQAHPVAEVARAQGLQANGHTVGFLGDGINDAPALRADVGISVDSGTDIAKESADIILLEKSLMVLEGVLKGRETFGNIMKYLCMTASSNFGNVFSVLVASAFIPFMPMLAIHLLLQNLMYDFSQLSLPWDRMDKEFLQARKWDAQHRPLHAVDRANVVDLRHHHLRPDVVRVRCQQRGDAGAVPVRLVHRRAAVADLGGAHAAHPQGPVPAEHRGAAGDAGHGLVMAWVSTSRSRRWARWSGWCRCRGSTSLGWPLPCWATAWWRRG